MNGKLFVIFASLFTILLVQQTACEEIEQVEQPDELYIINPGSAFPYIVTDPSSPILRSNDFEGIRFCIPSQCQSLCRSLGFRAGHCNAQAYCVCSR